MNISVFHEKGLGDSEVYVRIVNEATVWDFITLQWVLVETEQCRVFLSEFSADAVSSWYYGTVTPPPGGPWPVEIQRLSNGENIGNELAEKTTPLVGPGTIMCSDIITTVSRLLYDMTNITYPKAILLSYLNLAVKEIVTAKPEANSISGLILMVAGTRQILPTGWILLINAKRNMGSNGTTPGLAIRQVDRQSLEKFVPDWNLLPADTSVRFAATDDRDPYSFDVVPPQPSGTTQKIEAIGSAFPTKATDPDADAFPLPDEYEVPAVWLTLFYALSEATTIPNALAKAEGCRNKGYQFLGVKNQGEAKSNAEGQ